MNRLLSSINRWFRRLSYQRKFTVITAIFIFPILALTPLITNEVGRIERYGSDELFGTLYIRPLWKLANDLQRHQLAGKNFTDGTIDFQALEAVQKDIDADFENLELIQRNEIQSAPYQSDTAEFRTQWLAIKNAARNRDDSALQAGQDELYAGIHALISRVADESQLVLDPDLDTYYVANTVLFLMADNQKLTYEVYETIDALDANLGASPIEKEKITRLVENLESNMAQVDGNIRAALANNSRGGMEPILASPLAAYKSDMQTFTQFVHENVLDPASRDAGIDNVLGSHQLQFEKINKANQIFYSVASEALQAGVEARVNSLILRFYPTVIAVLASLAGAFLLGQNLMDSISKPLVHLINASQQLASGDLTTRVGVEGEDQLAKVANALNKMAGDLQADKTALTARADELEKANQSNEHRAQDLQTISEISRLISREQRLDTLLPFITRLVSEKYNFYHTGIFLVDDSRLFAVLQAANSEGGQRMLNRGHRLELGTGIVGTVALTGKSRIALDVGADAVFFDNPDLPATRSEMAIPLKIRSETIGALDVQSTRAGEFTEDDANTLAILADQIAITIENARLFARTQQALEEVQALYNQYLQKEWKSLQGRISNVGYWQTLSGGKPLEALVESDDIRHALQTGQTLITKANGSNTEPAVIVPIKLRGQTIGILNIKASVRDREWSRDELNLIQSVTDRLALALENARLFEDTSRRAERERLVSEITGKIRSATDPQVMIQTALEELRNALGASRVQVIPQTLPDSENNNE